MKLPEKVTIRELGAREGFQTLKGVVETEKKLALIEALCETGVGEIEIASFVRPDLLPQMADAEEIVAKLPKKEKIAYRALYLNESGFRRAVAFKQLDMQGWIHTATSDTFLKKNNNISIADSVQKIPRWMDLFSEFSVPFKGVLVSAAFGCTYEGRKKTEQIEEILKLVSGNLRESGFKDPFEVCLADTMGWAVPQMVRETISKLKRKLAGLDYSLHLHDTRGSAMACAYAGLLEGVSIFETSVAGIGGCPFAAGSAGNLCSEDFVFMCHEMGIETGINLERYICAAKLAAKIAKEADQDFVLSGRMLRTVAPFALL
jgi:hydroxymethylglutaryl-CoA lyase